MWRRLLCDWCNKPIEKNHESTELDHHLFHVKPTNCVELYREYYRNRVQRDEATEKPKSN